MGHPPNAGLRWGYLCNRSYNLQHSTTAVDKDITTWDILITVIGILASVGAILLCTEPTIRYFWTKLASFAGVAILCVLCSRHRLGVILAIVMFVVLRLMIWGLLFVLRKL